MEGNRYLDGVSSLWTNVHGHRVPELDAALKDQTDRIAHSTLLGLGSVPSIELARRLVEVAPEGLAKVFYSDSGSTAVEVALKMAFQYWQQTGAPEGKKRRFACVADAYHGDTIGSVSVGGDRAFSRHLQAPALRHDPDPLASLLPVPPGPRSGNLRHGLRRRRRGGSSPSGPRTWPPWSWNPSSRARRA